MLKGKKGENVFGTIIIIIIIIGYILLSAYGISQGTCKSTLTPIPICIDWSGESSISIGLNKLNEGGSFNKHNSLKDITQNLDDYVNKEIIIQGRYDRASRTIMDEDKYYLTVDSSCLEKNRVNHNEILTITGHIEKKYYPGGITKYKYKLVCSEIPATKTSTTKTNLDPIKTKVEIITPKTEVKNEITNEFIEYAKERSNCDKYNCDIYYNNDKNTLLLSTPYCGGALNKKAEICNNFCTGIELKAGTYILGVKGDNDNYCTYCNCI